MPVDEISHGKDDHDEEEGEEEDVVVRSSRASSRHSVLYTRGDGEPDEDDDQDPFASSGTLIRWFISYDMIYLETIRNHS